MYLNEHFKKDYHRKRIHIVVNLKEKT